jgi:ABC-type bacteriocin/lantibiotic exporter with double-glycine peptidase domain
VEVKGVSFTYPHTNKEVLSDCSFALREGECVALVGPNGCGKTTITMLLSKMYLPTMGDITFDGQSLSELKQLSLYQHLVYLMPQASVERLPIDIALAGVARDCIDYARLAGALQLVDMDEIVKNLPKGYQTQIGVNWGGVSFSTGQSQRLMIAATLYRAFDPTIKIVIFDEPMAHCDVEIKRMFYSSLKEFSQKIVLVIAHDPLYLSFFNRVISMKGGRIIADVRGQHAISEITDSVTRELAVDL